MLTLTKPEKKIILTVLSILIALCTVAYVAHRKSQRLIQFAQSIEQAEDIKYHIEEIQSILVDMESGVRGYVVTGDESYMAPANEAIANVFIHLHELVSLPGITPEQTYQLVELRKLADEKSTLTARIAEIRRQKGMEEAIAFMADGHDRKIMDQIRVITSSMILLEDRQLSGLKLENTRVLTHFAVSFYLLLLKISITVVTVVGLFILYFRKRNRTEKKLKESEDLFFDVLDHTASIISIKDLAGRYILINKAYEKLLKVPRESIKGNTVYDLFDRKVADAIRDTDMEVIRSQQQIKVEENIPLDEEMHHYQSMKFPLFDSNHLPYAICSISIDETEKLKSDQQHREEMHRILDLFNNAPCGYQSTNEEGIIIEINETLLNWLGYKRQEVIGRMPVKNLLSPESVHQFTYYFPRLRSGELTSLYDIEAVYLRKDGTRLPIIANTVATFDEEGNFRYTRTSVFDITFRKQMAEVTTRN